MASENHLVQHFHGLGYTVVADPDEMYVKFTIYEIVAWNGKTDKPAYELGHGGVTEDFNKAIGFLRGHVKWDGCSDWEFMPDENVMVHGCTKEDLLNIGYVMAACWEWTSKLLPHFEGDP